MPNFSWQVKQKLISKLLLSTASLTLSDTFRGIYGRLRGQFFSMSGAPKPARSAILFQAKSQFIELPWVDFGGGVRERAGCRLRFRKSNDFPDGFSAC